MYAEELSGALLSKHPDFIELAILGQGQLDMKGGSHIDI